jgi:2-phosphoglycolate phosphatase
MTMPIKAVLFDLDGTLIDTALDFFHVVQQLCAEQNKTAPTFEEVRNTVSKGARALTQLSLHISPDHPDFEAQNQRLLALYALNLSVKSHLFTGMENLLTTLEKHHIAWGVVTNKPYQYALPLLNNLQLAKRCAVIICPDHVKNKKPDPEGLLLACSQIGCLPHEAIYIGDDERDIQAGKSAQFKTTIAALYGYIGVHEQPFSWQADVYAKTVDDITLWFNQHIS